LTLYTTPVVYIYLDKLQTRMSEERKPPAERSHSPPNDRHLVMVLLAPEVRSRS